MKKIFRQPSELTRRLPIELLYFSYIAKSYSSPRSPARSHVVCGRNRFTGLANGDISSSAEIASLERRLPFRSGSSQHIYSVYVMKHVPYPVTVSFLDEGNLAFESRGGIWITMP